jgi:hypothetical protein
MDAPKHLPEHAQKSLSMNAHQRSGTSIQRNIMKRMHAMVIALLLLSPTLFSAASLAGPGHDHGQTTTPSSGSALPRFTATSEAFELVGILNERVLTLYLDRFEDNSPVRDARIELDIAGVIYTAQKNAENDDVVMLKDALAPGVIAVTATITAGTLTDLLAGELDLQEDLQPPKAQGSWRSTAIGTGLGLLTLLMAWAAIARFRQHAPRG